MLAKCGSNRVELELDIVRVAEITRDVGLLSIEYHVRVYCDLMKVTQII